MGKLFNSGIFNLGGGTYSKVPLLSITTAPTGSFVKGSSYFRNEDGIPAEDNKKIYTAVADNTWEGAKVSDPQWGTYYVYNNHAYIWDGNSLEYFELEDYQPKLVSGVNIKTINEQSILGSGNLNIGTNRSFPTTWPTNTTFDSFLKTIFTDTSAVQGNSYLGELTCSGLPTGINNAEAIVEIMTSAVASSKCIHVILTSGNVNPYRWEYTAWHYNTQTETYDKSNWIGFQPTIPFTGTDGSTNGTSGIVPAPATTDAGKYLKADGTWDDIIATAPAVYPFIGPYAAPYNVLSTGITLSNYDTISVYKNGVLLQKTTTDPVTTVNDYTIVGNDIVFTKPLENIDKITLILFGVVSDGGSGVLALEKVQGIEPLIPAEATSSNKLADKLYVASAVSTGTANCVTSTEITNIVPVTQDEYDAMVQAGTIVPTTLYAIKPAS